MYIRKDGTTRLTVNFNDKIDEKIKNSKKTPLSILNKELDNIIDKKKKEESLGLIK